MLQVGYSKAFITLEPGLPLPGKGPESFLAQPDQSLAITPRNLCSPATLDQSPPSRTVLASELAVPLCAGRETDS